MLCIFHQSTDPYFNIATDEYILKHIKEDCFMLWRNDNAIIIGKYQNALAEINYEYVKANNIHVVRRISGGGAVYHDLGNLNFSFTKQGENMSLMDFEGYTKPIVDVLQEMGVNAKFEGRNDLMIDGLKISGNAEHIFRNKILHHGTLLFSSQMKNVSEALKTHPLKFQDKAVKSIPKRVTNIADHMPEPISIEEFTKRIMDHVVASFPDCKYYEFTPEDIAAIEKLKQEKYMTDEWNYGLVADYNFQKAVKTPGGILEIHMEVQKGIIEKIKIFGDFFNLRDVEDIEQTLVNCKHEEQALRTALSTFKIEEYFHGITIEDIINAMF
ncbi:MAG TPA: lipoate--protein ligase [Edaphocola sp.]|nr:lipoate--protein ligase [Edaphocola sp.]